MVKTRHIATWMVFVLAGCAADANQPSGGAKASQSPVPQAAVPAGMGQDALAKGFVSPPPSARPWVYWFPLNGNISKEGITADLEAMARVGIGGVLYMEVDQGAPIGPAAFAGPQWRDLIKFAVSEAHRLGLQVNMNNDAGWCGSGGPWITPELAQKKLVWTETSVQGGVKADVVLPQPTAVANYYEDVAVLAFPTPAGEETKMSAFSPKVTFSPPKAAGAKKPASTKPATAATLPAVEKGKPQYVQIEFAQPFAARSLNLTATWAGRSVCHGAIQVSDEGKAFRTICNFIFKSGSVTVNFDETAAKFFRVVVTDPSGKVDSIKIGAAELTNRYSIDNIQAKAAFTPAHVPPVYHWPPAPAGVTIPRDGVVNLTGKMDASGKLAWDVPAGKWTVLRIGYTPTGKDNHPAPEAGRGLECDKLDKAGAEAMFAGLMAKLVADSKPLVPGTLVSTHIDSWEVGSQNWSKNFREEFQKRRGYDPLPFLPTMTGRVVDSLEVSERFLWDLRQTVSDLLVENYAGHFRTLANKHGMRLSIEAYDGCPCDEMTYGGQADEPMAEFWSWTKFGAAYSCTEMSSSAHIYGKKILGAEAFTATDAEKWQGHPGNIKDLGDWAFCEGINRFVFHRYALQPWTNPDRKPGMSMGPWGLHYERTQTWWNQSVAWHEYLARCQFLLQQGLFVADICCLQPEGSPMRFTPPPSVRPAGSLERPKYNFDGCTPEVVLTRMTVKDGRLVLPDGMSYRVLVLPDVEAMTPKLLRKIKELVEAGATVVGGKPTKSPSLGNYPKCDEEVKKLADEMWHPSIRTASERVGGVAISGGPGIVLSGQKVKEKPIENGLGKGKVIWGGTPAEILADMGVAPDFDYHTRTGGQCLRFIHKTIDGVEAYFVANKTDQAVDAVCSFRVKGMTPEIWRPQTGQIERPAAYEQAGDCTRMAIHFDPVESMFVVFRPAAGGVAGGVTSVTCNGKEILTTAAPKEKSRPADNNLSVHDTFTMACWARPVAQIPLPKEANAGVHVLTDKHNYVVYPAPGHEVYTEAGQSGSGIDVGTNGVCVYEHGDSYFAPVLVYASPITGWTHLAVVYKDGVPSLFVNGKCVKTGLKGMFTAHPAVGVEHTRSVTAFEGDVSYLQEFPKALGEAEIAKLMESAPKADRAAELPPIELVRGLGGELQATIYRKGTYAIKTSDGKTATLSVPSLPDAMAVAGPWTVQFAPGGGAPAKVTLDKLISWSDHPDAGVKYFSGTATYGKSLIVPADMLGMGRRAILDLGRVAVMAEVKLNGKSLGILWKAPFRVDITSVAQPGENALEVKVVNLWINRQIGDEQLPDDSDRNANGTLKEWPKWLSEGKPSPTGRFTFTSWRLYKKDSPLVESGLLGPVTLHAAERVGVEVK